MPESYVPESDSFYDFDSELDADGKKMILKHIFDEDEVIDVLLKLLTKYENTSETLTTA